MTSSNFVSLYGESFDSIARPMASDDGIHFKAMSSESVIDDAQGIVECFVAAVGNKDSVGDIVAPGAFDGSLRRRRPRVVWGHDWNSPIGKVLDIYEVSPRDPRLPAKMREAGVGGLFAKVQFNLRSERGREAFESVRFFGNDQEWSIGYKTIDAVYDNMRKANVLREVELYEVSPVLHGANQLTGTISIKSDSLTGSVHDEFADYSDYIGEKSAQPLRDPDGGLTAAGRAHFKRTEGANLKPGVKGPADTPEKMRRKGSFLTRFFTNPSGPMKNDKGEPTRLALSARAWGEPVPQNMEDAKKLAAKGRRLLDRYSAIKGKGYGDNELVFSGETDFESKNDYAGDDDAVPAMNPALGRMANLGKALSVRFGGTVHVRESDKNQVIFDHNDDDDEKHTFRVSYHYEDGQFMFGDPVQVKPEVVYLPVAGEEDGEQDDYPYHEGIDVPELEESGGRAYRCTCGAKTGYSDIDEKAGRVLSGRNLQRVREALTLLEAVVKDAGGGMEMKTDFIYDVKTEHAIDLAATIEPVALRYGATVAYSEYDGIVRIQSPYEFSDQMIQDAHDAASNAGLDASWNLSHNDQYSSSKVSA